jgi:hypothetical protein
VVLRSRALHARLTDDFRTMDGRTSELRGKTNQKDNKMHERNPRQTIMDNQVVYCIDTYNL